MTTSLALAHLRAGRTREALTTAEAEIALHPDSTDALFVCAIALEDLGHADKALGRYDELLRQIPDFEPALHNRGLLLARVGRFDEAERNHREYVAAHPGSPRARLDLGDVLLARGRYAEAEEQFDQALLQAPDNISALVGQGMARASLRRFGDARRSFSAASSTDSARLRECVTRIAPGADPAIVLSPESIYLWRCHVALGHCDWSEWTEYLEVFREVLATPETLIDSALAFAALHLPLSASDRLSVTWRATDSVEQRSPVLPARPARRRSKLRVGVLSPDFREHLNARLLLPLFELSDRQRFEFYAYSLAKDDGSRILRDVTGAAAACVDLTNLDDAAAAARIRADQVDILLDVGGHTTGGRFGITARRPATLQVQYLGFAGSLASRRVDYAIVDPAVAPRGAAREWAETLAYLPRTYYLYDFREPVPPLPISRRDYGIPEEAFVYCAFHKAEKITPPAFGMWMRILEQADGSVMWFLSLPVAAVENLRAAAKARGVDPARLRFAPFEPRERYLARQRLGDLMIDALHHSAMTTACDALAGGLPVLTMKGESMASRACESLVRAAGLPELVAPDAESFIDHAVRLAAGNGELAGLRKRLEGSRQRAPLFDTASRVRELEWALLHMHQRALRKEEPASFDVPEISGI